MDGPGDYHTKQSHKEKDNTLWYHLQAESKIGHKRTYLQNRNRLADTETDLWSPREKGKGVDGVPQAGKGKERTSEWW